LNNKKGKPRFAEKQAPPAFAHLPFGHQLLRFRNCPLGEREKLIVKSEAPGVCFNSFNFKEFMNLESSNGFRAKRGFSVPAKHDAPQHSSNAFDSAFGFQCFSF
jgi:hypothetical protein